MKTSRIDFVNLHGHSVAGSIFDGLGFPQDHMNYAYEKTKVLMNENAGLSNQEKYDLQAEILKLYEISKEFFKKSKSNVSKNALQILNDNIKRFEKAHGEIRDYEQPPMPLNFGPTGQA